MPHACSRRAGSMLVAALLAALVPAGCGGGCDGTRRAPPGATGPDTGRVGRTFVVTYDDGPVDRLRVVRDTAGGIVVEGASGFADGTQVTIALLARNAAGELEPIAVTRATVALGRFAGQPLVPVDGPRPDTPVHVRLTAPFGPGQQSDAVRQATADGRRYRGHGMRETPAGDAVYEVTLEAPL